jgi:hypothetical protein
VSKASSVNVERTLLSVAVAVAVEVEVAVEVAVAVAVAVVIDFVVAVVVAVDSDPNLCPQPLPPRSRHPAIFHLFQPPFHLLHDHLPRIRFQFELVLERSLSCLNEGKVRPHLIE